MLTRRNGFPLIIAHSGCMDTPPNSIESVRRGFEEGADGVEVDARALRDGTVILSHDAHEAFETLGFEELITVAAGGILGPEPATTGVARLLDVLEVVRRYRGYINIDVKVDGVAGNVADTVFRAEMENAAYTTGSCRELAGSSRSISVFLNLDSPDGRPGESRYTQSVTQLCSDGARTGVVGVNIDWRDCTEEFVRIAHGIGLLVSVYTVDVVEKMRQIVADGADLITTNNVRELVALRYSFFGPKKRNGSRE